MKQLTKITFLLIAFFAININLFAQSDSLSFKKYYLQREQSAPLEIRNKLNLLREEMKNKKYNYEIGYTEISKYKLEDVCNIKLSKNFNLFDIQNKYKTNYYSNQNQIKYCNASDIKYDPRLKNKTPNIQDQQGCGSCWGFSAISTFESNIIHKLNIDKRILNLSEQQVLACSNAGNCKDGGTTWGVFEWLCSGNALTDEITLPYDYSTLFCSNNINNKIYKGLSWGFVNFDGNYISNVNDIKKAICEHGAVSSGIYASDLFLAHVGYNVFYQNNEDFKGHGINHFVSIVGWDDEKGAWLIKNSWGNNWGMNGFAWVKYNSNLLGYATTWVEADINNSEAFVCPPSEALSNINELEKNPEIFNYTGGIKKGEIKSSICKPNNGNGYWIEGKNQGSFYFYSCQLKRATAVWGAIREKWNTVGNEHGIFGWPTESHKGTPTKPGAYTHFQGGSIYWSPKTSAHFIWGAIRDKWSSIGWENSELGFPKTDEITNPNNIGLRQEFENGIMYFSNKTGAHYILFNQIFDKWKSQNYEQGPLGLPIDEAKRINGVLCQRFQGGEICGDKINYNNMKISLTLKKVDKFGGIRSYGEVGVCAHKQINNNISVNNSIVGSDYFFYCHNKEQYNQYREEINKTKTYEYSGSDFDINNVDKAIIRLFYRIEGQYNIRDDNHKGLENPTSVIGDHLNLVKPIQGAFLPSSITSRGHFSDCNGYLGRDIYESRDIILKKYLPTLFLGEKIILTDKCSYDGESAVFTYELSLTN